MPVKPTKKAARSMRYLLYADGNLRRLSLRKMAERVITRKRSPRGSRSKDGGRSKRAGRATDSASRATAVLVAAGIVIAVVLLASRQSSQRVDAGASEPQPSSRTVPDKPAAPVTPDTKKVVAAVVPPAPPKALVADAAPIGKAPVSPAKSPALPPQPLAAGLMATATPEAAPMATEGTDTTPPVTISGCLDVDDATYWLRDTDGVNAPKSRSWKTGFLRKRSTPVAVVDVANTLELRRHVGQRVSATGILSNGELRARSLQNVATSCS